MKGSKTSSKSVLNDDLLDKKLQELGTKLKGVKVVEQVKDKNVFTQLSNKKLKKEQKESLRRNAEESPEEEEVVKPKTLTPVQREAHSSPDADKSPDSNKSPVRQQKDNKKKKNEPKAQSSVKKQPQNNNFKLLKYALLAIGLISCYLLLKKHQKLFFNFEKDYYDQLEIDQSATTAEIKAQFKKLALKFHPDKNKNCGPSCAIRFSELNAAYEIIGNEETRKSYDSTLGAKFTEVRSKSPTLKATQYNVMVLDSDDFWVIQVFSDNDRNSNYFGQFWETVYDQLKSSISMARINFREKDKFYWLNSMKLSEDNMPLVFSYHKDQGFKLASLDLNRGEQSLKTFIRDSIPNHINTIRSGDVQSMISKVQASKITSVLILSLQSKTPINVLALGLKLKGYIDIYINAHDQTIQPIQKQLNETKANVLVMYHDGQLQFKHHNIEKNQEDNDLNAIIQPLLLLSQPYIYLNNLGTFCYNKLNIQQDIICILLNSKYVTKDILRDVHDNQIKQYLKNSQKEDFLPIQFGLIDLEDQEVLGKFLVAVKPNNMVKAFVIEAAQQKFQVFTELEDIEALIDDINHQEYDYMNYYQTVETTHELFTNKYQSYFQRFTGFVSFKFQQDPISVFVIIGLEVLLFQKIKNPQMRVGACVVLLLSYISYLL